MPVRKLKVSRPTGVGLFMLFSAAIIWFASLQGVDPYEMTNFGLLSVLHLSFYVALGILVVSTCLIIYQQKVPEYLFLLHVSLFILIVHGTPPILYGTLRYSWAWKHIGIIDYIQRHGYVNPHEQFLEAYHNWPGFFSANALITQIAGLDSSVTYAPWSQLFFNLVDMGAILLLLKSVTTDRRLAWLGVWFFFLTSWVGQDYFAPQAMGYLLYLVCIGVAVHWFGDKLNFSQEAVKRWLRFDWLAALFRRGFVCNPMPSTFGADRPWQRVGLVMIIVLGFITIASSHQFTPIMTISAFLVLVVFGCCTIRTLPILIIVLTVVWILYVAIIFLQSEIQSLVESFGQVTDNVGSSLIQTSALSSEQQLVSKAGRFLTAGLWGLAFLGMVRKFFQGSWNLPIALLAIAPFFILAGNAYGGEALFRTYLFSLPAMAFFAAAFLIPNDKSGRLWVTLVAMSVISSMLLVGLLYAYYGKDRQYYFTELEYKASEYLYTFAPDNSLLIQGSSNYPSQYRRYEILKYVPISREDPEVHQKMLADPVAFFSRWMDSSQFAQSYFLITRSQKIEIEMLGDMPEGALDTIEQALLNSPQFRVVFQNRDARIFVLADANTRETR